jgi:transposase
MRFAGIDIGHERHVVAVVDEHGQVLCRSSPFREDATGYRRLVEVLGSPDGCLIVFEATGHYSRNLFLALVAKQYAVAVVNPLRTRRFAEEELERTKTDAIDALGIARFAAQKRPSPTPPRSRSLEELRELVGIRTRLSEDLGRRLRQLHCAVDLGFPEFTRHVRALDSPGATAMLKRYPTAGSFRRTSLERLAWFRYGRRRRVGKELGRVLIDSARNSVGQHDSRPHRLWVRYICRDIHELRRRLDKIEHSIDRNLDTHQVANLLMTIQGIGRLTAARLIAELGDPARFRNAAALASYAGVAPRLRQSGKRRFKRMPLPLGNRRLRQALWMPTLRAIRHNGWLRAFYDRLRSAGKPAKVAQIATMRKLLVAVGSVLIST